MSKSSLKLPESLYLKQESPFFTVTVNDPHKVESKSAISANYAVYNVKAVRADNGSVCNSTRRYTDFFALYNDLKKRHPSSIIPAFPTAGNDLPGNARFTPDVLNFRSREFTRFLRQVCSHKELSKDEIVERFLTAAEYKPVIKENPTFSLFSAASKKIKEISVPDDTDKFFVDIPNHLNKTEVVLSKLIHDVDTLISKEKDVVNAYKHVAESLSEFGSVFEKEGISETNQESAKNVSTESKSVNDVMCAAVNEMIEYIEHETVELHDNLLCYQHEIASIKDVLTYRIDVLRSFRETEKSVLELQPKVDAMVKSGKADKSKKLQNELEKLDLRLQDQRMLLSEVSKQIKNELIPFESQQTKNLMQVISTFKLLNRLFYKKVSELWGNETNENCSHFEKDNSETTSFPQAEASKHEQNDDASKTKSDIQPRVNETNEFFHEDVHKNVSKNDGDDPSIF